MSLQENHKHLGTPKRSEIFELHRGSRIPEIVNLLQLPHIYIEDRFYQMNLLVIFCHFAYFVIIFILAKNDVTPREVGEALNLNQRDLPNKLVFFLTPEPFIHF